MRTKSQGATLVELIITVAVFSLLSIATFAIMRMGSGTLTMVDARSDVQHSLQLFETNLTTELKRASLASVGIYTPDSDYRWAIWMKEPMNETTADVAVTGKLGDPLVCVLDASNHPVMQRYVLFYVALMDKSDHDGTFGATCNAAYTSGVAPETKCPHKWIVRKDIYLTDNKLPSGSDSIGVQGGASTVANLQRYLTDKVSQSALLGEPDTPASGEPNNVARVQIMADNVVSFELARLRPAGANAPPVNDPKGPIILFDVKLFKGSDAQHKVPIGSQNIVNVAYTAGNTGVNTTVVGGDAYSGSTVAPQYQSFTVQLDNRVVPQNP